MPQTQVCKKKCDYLSHLVKFVVTERRPTFIDKVDREGVSTASSLLSECSTATHETRFCNEPPICPDCNENLTQTSSSRKQAVLQLFSAYQPQELIPNISSSHVFNCNLWPSISQVMAAIIIIAVSSSHTSVSEQLSARPSIRLAIQVDWKPRNLLRLCEGDTSTNPASQVVGEWSTNESSCSLVLAVSVNTYKRTLLS